MEVPQAVQASGRTTGFLSNTECIITSMARADVPFLGFLLFKVFDFLGVYTWVWMSS